MVWYMPKDFVFILKILDCSLQFFSRVLDLLATLDLAFLG
jgi:hypothetical protein